MEDYKDDMQYGWIYSYPSELKEKQSGSPSSRIQSLSPKSKVPRTSSGGLAPRNSGYSSQMFDVASGRDVRLEHHPEDIEQFKQLYSENRQVTLIKKWDLTRIKQEVLLRFLNNHSVWVVLNKNNNVLALQATVSCITSHSFILNNQTLLEPVTVGDANVFVTIDLNEKYSAVVGIATEISNDEGHLKCSYYTTRDYVEMGVPSWTPPFNYTVGINTNLREYDQYKLAGGSKLGNNFYGSSIMIHGEHCYDIRKLDGDNDDKVRVIGDIIFKNFATFARQFDVPSIAIPSSVTEMTPTTSLTSLFSQMKEAEFVITAANVNIKLSLEAVFPHKKTGPPLPHVGYKMTANGGKIGLKYSGYIFVDWTGSA